VKLKLSAHNHNRLFAYAPSVRCLKRSIGPFYLLRKPRLTPRQAAPPTASPVGEKQALLRCEAGASQSNRYHHLPFRAPRVIVALKR